MLSLGGWTGRRGAWCGRGGIRCIWGMCCCGGSGLGGGRRVGLRLIVGFGWMRRCWVGLMALRLMRIGLRPRGTIEAHDCARQVWVR